MPIADYNAVGPAAIALYGFIKAMQLEDPSLQFVFDPQLTIS